MNCLFPVVALPLLLFRIPTKTFHRTKPLPLPLPLPPRLPTAAKTWVREEDVPGPCPEDLTQINSSNPCSSLWGFWETG